MGERKILRKYRNDKVRFSNGVTRTKRKRKCSQNYEKYLYLLLFYIIIYNKKRFKNWAKKFRWDLIENLSLEEKNMEKNKKKEEVKSSIRKILKQKPGEKLMNTLYIVQLKFQKSHWKYSLVF